MITHNRRKLERGYFLWPLAATAHASGLFYAALFMNRPGVGTALVLCGFLSGLILGMAAYRVLRHTRKREPLSATDPYITLADNLPVGICRSSQDGKFLMANPAFARLFGYTSVAELIRIPVSEMYEDPTDRAALIQEVLEKGEVVRREVLMRRKDGTPFWVAVTVKVVRDATGNIQYFEGLFEDIHKAKRSEERIIRLNDCLLHLSEDPTENITRLVHLGGELLDASCAAYNRLEGELLCSLARWHTPDDFRPVDKASGHICTDVILQGGDDVVLVTDLPHSRYAETDPNVLRYGLKTYMGKAVKVGDRYVGSLCIVYTDDYEPDAEDKHFLSIIASAVAVEEHRARFITELRENEERFRTITASTVDAIVMIDDEGKVCSWNQAATDMFGYAPQEVLGKDLHELIAPDRFLQQAHEGMEAFRKTGKGAVFGRTLEMQALRKDGSEFSVELTVSRVQYRGKWHAIAVIRDVTERIEAQRELYKIRAAVEHAGDAIGISDVRGRPIFVNQAFQRLFEYDVHSLRRVGGATGLFADRAFARAAATAALRGEPYEGETEVRTRSGKTIPVIFRSGIIRDDSGAVIGLVGVYTDIAERKRAETLLAEHAKRLEATNLELEKAIERANRMAYEAEAANRAKSAFLANMSHEIRTPLNGVIGMTELLLGTKLTEEQREFAEIVRSSADALLSVINDILDFSKIEAGKIDLERIEFDLRTTVEDVADVLAHRAHQKGLEMIVLIQHDVPQRLKGDPGRLRQVLLNLLGNAVKFTDHGEVVIRTRGGQIRDNQVEVHFEVADTGVGIAPEVIPSLFKPFTQADSSITRRFGGTGLGLAISKQLVNLMGGDISVESELGRGTTFRFWIPFELVPAPTADKVQPQDVLKGLRILVVDDSPTNREVFRSFLKNWGCIVEETGDPRQALSMLQDAAASGKPFQVVLLDYMMPGMDGAAVADAIKQNPETAKAHLVLLTSSPQRGDAARARSVGIAAYLTKPVKQRLLRDCLLELVHPDRQTDKQQEPPLVTSHSIREKKRTTKKILLVEDNPINQKVAIRMLERLGYHCDCASNGREAVAAVLSSRYDLVLMDCQMPEMDGFAATRAIREKEPAGCHTPIVALTALAMKGDAERCQEAGMDDYLAKPIEMTELNRVLTQWLGDSDETVKVPLPTASVDVPVDLARLQEVCDGDLELERELIQTFDEDSKERIVEMATLVKNQDAAALRITAHALKGASANMGAKRMRELSASLEQMASSGNLDQAESVLEKLKRAQEETHAVFLDYLASRSH